MCSKHYQRWKRYGDPLKVAWDRGNPEANFMAKVVKDESGCWLWTGYTDRDGYGHFGVWDGSKKDDWPAHRWLYQHVNGPIPEGLNLDHLCRVRNCVNPAHLEPVTNAENIRRGMVGVVRGAQQRAKTHCPQGHPYDEANTIFYGGAKRYRRCRACEAIRKKRTPSSKRPHR